MYTRHNFVRGIDVFEIDNIFAVCSWMSDAFLKKLQFSVIFFDEYPTNRYLIARFSINDCNKLYFMKKVHKNKKIKKD